MTCARKHKTKIHARNGLKRDLESTVRIKSIVKWVGWGVGLGCLAVVLIIGAAGSGIVWASQASTDYLGIELGTGIEGYAL